MLMHRVVLCTVLSFSVRAQIRIIAPDTLKRSFESTDGVITGATAVFGAPYYGKHILGRLRTSTSKGNHYCSEDDYDLQPVQSTGSTDIHDISSFSRKGEHIHDILVLEHSTYCSACKKARIAQSKGVSAVVFVDPSGDSAKKVQEKILGDDGWGSEVRIPSILVSRAVGDQLLSVSSQSAKEVIVELAWDIPQSQVVSVDFWWSSGARGAEEFLRHFKEYAEVLGHSMQFVPHYYVFDVPEAAADSMGQLCTDAIGTKGVRHCAPDPDGPGPITGSDVANEDVRQLCLWHKTTQGPAPGTGVGDAKFSQFWWDYVSRIYDVCPLEAENRQLRFGSKTCSYKEMASMDLDLNVIDACVRHYGEEYLEESASEGAWSEEALRINGWRYQGALDPETVLKAVCSGFSSPLPACEELVNGWMRKTVHMLKHKAFSGLSKNAFGLLMGSICILSVINCYLYRRHLQKFLKKQMREEVMLEVQSQMSEYGKLSGGASNI